MKPQSTSFSVAKRRIIGDDGPELIAGICFYVVIIGGLLIWAFYG